MDEEKKTRRAIDRLLFGLMFLLLMTLKLCGVIGWAWWWVAVPLWGPPTVSICFMFVGGVVRKVLRKKRNGKAGG